MGSSPAQGFMQGLLRPQRERVDLMTTTTSRERNGVPHVWLYDKKKFGSARIQDVRSAR
jgi:hypothetical protein